MGFRLAELFVDITANDKQAMAGIGRVKSAFSSLGTKLLAAGGAIGVGAFIGKSIEEAANLAETVDFARIVFGDSFGEMEGFADSLAQKFGIAKRASLDMAVGIAGIGKNLGGLKGEKLADFAKATSMMAIDMASAMNLSEEEAGRAIAITLAGNQSDLMRQKGVNILDEDVTKRARQEGVVGAKETPTDQQKLAIRLIMLEEQLADTIGNRAATATSAANMQRTAMGQMTTVYTQFGSAVMPIWTGVLQAASEALNGINGWLGSSADGVNTWAQTIAGWLSAIGVAFRNWDLGVQIVAVTFGQYMTNIEEWITWAFGVMDQYGNWFADNWVNGIKTALDFMWTVFQNVFANIVNLVRASWDFITNPGGGFNFEFQGLLDGFESSMAKLPEIAAPHLSNFQSQIDELTMQMSDAEAARANAATDIATQKLGDIGREILATANGEENAGAGTGADKAKTTTLEGFAKNLLESGFAKDKALKAAETTAEGVTKLVELGKQTNPLSAKDIFAMAAP